MAPESFFHALSDHQWQISGNPAFVLGLRRWSRDVVST